MFLPIFIAILMGLVSPNCPNTNTGQGTVQVNSTTEDGGDEGDDDGGGSTGGNTGQTPPPKDQIGG
ncbi:hypothetical protein [Pedobacter sp. BMA]|uniref:hypothetical protein n=1 Tax=Pedobacter sp. BMA TaxID=1663685 RepID=UPI00064B2C4C|nr:hypothetical protein [Pedobacter sp. BMA]KLT64790.1 hypothetical protein AB669_13725 [Pedobacter sp. BMA]